MLRRLLCAVFAVCLFPPVLWAHLAPEEALEVLGRQLAADPTRLDLEVERARLFAELGRRELADQLLERVLGLARQRRAAATQHTTEARAKELIASTLLARGRLRYAGGDFAGALADARALTALHPSGAAAALAARSLRASGELRESVGWYRRAISGGPGPAPTPDLYDELSRVYLALADAPQAAAVLEEGIERLGGAASLVVFRERLLAATPRSRTARYDGPDAGPGGAATAGGAPESRIAARDAVSDLVVYQGPYLQRASPTGVMVCWRTDEPVLGRVRIEGPGGRVFTEHKLQREHRMTIRGLRPYTTYRYTISDDQDRTFAGHQEASWLRTPPLAGAHRPLRIWAIGDSGTANRSAQSVRDAMYAWTAAHPWRGARLPDLWLMLGDNAYPTGTSLNYRRGVFDSYPWMLRHRPLWPVFGNHDAASADSASQTGPYYRAMSLPTKGEIGGLPSGTEAYYSFDVGNVHVIALDSTGESSLDPGGPMLTWTRLDAAATVQDWVIAMWHHPPYSKGSHDSDDAVHEPLSRAMRENVLPILEQAGVDLVLSGHSHSYERSVLVSGAYDTPTSDAGIVDPALGFPLDDHAYQVESDLGSGGLGTRRRGTVYAVVGSSGKTGAPKGARHPLMVAPPLVELGSLVLDVDADRLDAFFVDAQARTRDRVRLLHGDAGGSSERIPGVVGAYGVEGSASVDLVFNKLLDPRDAEDVGRFAVDGLPPIAASLDDAGWIVHLELARALSAAPMHALEVAPLRDQDAVAKVSLPLITGFQAGVRSEPIAVGALWRYLEGVAPPPSDWTTLEADDAQWSLGPSGLGYGDGDDATVLSSMRGSYLTLYVRHRFEILDPAAVQRLLFDIDYDDGFVAYLNGTEVVRRNVPYGQGPNQPAEAHEAGSPERFDLTHWIPALRGGENVLAIEVHNRSLDSSDLSLIPRLEAVVYDGPRHANGCPTGRTLCLERTELPVATEGDRTGATRSPPME